MKYLAIVDDKFLSNFIVENTEFFSTDTVLVVKDKTDSTRGIRLKPLQAPMFVSENGQSVYLSQSHIDCLLEMERKQIHDSIINDLKSIYGLKEKTMPKQFINQPIEERVHVCGLIDGADGDAHEVACHLVPLTDAFATALQLLHDSSDHVCIIDDENYTRLEHTYTSLAPFSINISAGGHLL